MRQGILVFALLFGLPAASAFAQPDIDRQRMERQRARPHYLQGWQHMRVEAWEDAVRSFRQAIDIDQSFEDAYYGLGRAQMAQRRFVEAIASYEKSRELYRAIAGQRFSNLQDAQRYRRDRLEEIDQVLREYQQGPIDQRAQERARQLMEQRRQLKESLDRGNVGGIDNTVPGFVSLALGSAYFRAGRLADAEREYKAAIAMDSKSGEAHSNLAVVYMETGRLTEAEQAVRAAERAGYKVHPQLKQDIKERARGGGA